MAGKKKAAPPPSDEELTAQVLEALKESAQTKSQLGERAGKAAATRALELARELARQGRIHRFAKGNKEVFFAEDPIARLDRTVPELLRRQGPLNKTAIEKAVKDAAANHAPCLPDWLTSALARGVVYAGRGKTTTYAAEPPAPDLKRVLDKALASLRKALGPLEARGVTRAQVVEFLRVELGVPDAEPRAASAPGAPSRSVGASRDVFLGALRRFAADNPKGALLPVRELRARSGLAKQEFDAAALALSKEGLLVLHHHDHAASLSEADQNALVRDALGQHYVGVALRASA